MGRLSMGLRSLGLRSLAVAVVLSGCGGSGDASSAAGTSASTSSMTAGAEAPHAGPYGTLSLVGPSGARQFGGDLPADLADMTSWDPAQGRLSAYFGSGDAAFGVDLNLGVPFAVGERTVTTGPVVFTYGEGFEQRVDVARGTVRVLEVDTNARTLHVSVEGTASDTGEQVLFEANVTVPGA